VGSAFSFQVRIQDLLPLSLRFKNELNRVASGAVTAGMREKKLS